MIQQINLAPYIPENKVESLLTKQIVVICLLFFVLLIGYNFFYAWITHKLQADINQAQLNQQISLYNLESIKTDHADQLADDYLENQLTEISEDIEAKKKIISILSDNKSIPNVDGFSHFFTKLGETTLSNVWLSSIQISKGGREVKLIGHAIDGKNVLKYTDKLNATGMFDGKPLAMIDLSQSNDNDISSSQFTLYGETEGNI